jgi:hypothetical protein
MIGPGGEADFVGQNIGRSSREDAERNVLTGDSIHSLVYRAVTARGEDEIASRGNSLHRQFTGHLRARGSI